MEIRLIDVIGDRATDMKQGDTVCNQILDAFSKDEKVVLDFGEMKTILSTFLNNAVGSLYKSYTGEYLKANLRIVNLCDDDMFILQRVIKRAKEFYANEQLVTSSLNESLTE